MWEQIKFYAIQYGLKKYAPMAAMGGLAALGTFAAAHAGMLEQWGVTYGSWPFSWPSGNAPSGPCILIELDTTSTAAIAALTALATVVFRATQQHTTGTPVVQGGERIDDPPAATPPKES